MQTVRKLRKRSGFTLVELLIVIIIIGILAGAMLLVAGSGTDSAEATKIISGLRSMKAAALMYYADNVSNTSLPDPASLDKYMDGGKVAANYETSGDKDSWFVTYNLASADASDGVIKKLTDSDAVKVTADEGTAYMQAR